MPQTYIKYYWLENYIFNDVHEKFNRDGYLQAFDFFSIIIWKANRAKSNIAKRLLNNNSDLEQSVRDLTNKIFLAPDNKQRLKVLIEDYKFLLPMSSAILTILYPEDFTIYDVRVCAILPEFKGLDNTKDFEKKWIRYSEFVNSVKSYVPQDISLRDKDRFLFGKSIFEQLTLDLKNNFKK